MKIILYIFFLLISLSSCTLVTIKENTKENKTSMGIEKSKFTFEKKVNLDFSSQDIIENTVQEKEEKSYKEIIKNEEVNIEKKFKVLEKYNKDNYQVKMISKKEEENYRTNKLNYIFINYGYIKPKEGKVNLEKGIDRIDIITKENYLNYLNKVLLSNLLYLDTSITNFKKEKKIEEKINSYDLKKIIEKIINRDKILLESSNIPSLFINNNEDLIFDKESGLYFYPKKKYEVKSEKLDLINLKEDIRKIKLRTYYCLYFEKNNKKYYIDSRSKIFISFLLSKYNNLKYIYEDVTDKEKVIIGINIDDKQFISLDQLSVLVKVILFSEFLQYKNIEVILRVLDQNGYLFYTDKNSFISSVLKINKEIKDKDFLPKFFDGKHVEEFIILNNSLDEEKIYYFMSLHHFLRKLLVYDLELIIR